MMENFQALLLQTEEPVSYTHLDVYKRQAFDGYMSLCTLYIDEAVQ